MDFSPPYYDDWATMMDGGAPLNVWQVFCHEHAGKGWSIQRMALEYHKRHLAKPQKQKQPKKQPNKKKEKEGSSRRRLEEQLMSDLEFQRKIGDDYMVKSQDLDRRLKLCESENARLLDQIEFMRSQYNQDGFDAYNQDGFDNEFINGFTPPSSSRKNTVQRTGPSSRRRQDAATAKPGTIRHNNQRRNNRTA